jgi:hypothetical protein
MPLGWQGAGPYPDRFSEPQGTIEAIDLLDALENDLRICVNGIHLIFLSTDQSRGVSGARIEVNAGPHV